MTDQPRLALNDGHDMPQLGYGVFQVPPEDTERLVADAIDLGYQAVDTAAFYRDGAEVGRAVRDSGKSIFVTNKLPEVTSVHWHGMHLPARMDGGPHQMVSPGEVWEPHWAIDHVWRLIARMSGNAA